MSEKDMGKKVLTPECRLAFAQLFTAKAFGKQEAKFSATFVFPKTVDILNLKQAASQAAFDRWGAQANDPAFFGSLRTPFRDGAEYAKFEGFGPDVVFVKATTNMQPELFGPGGRTDVLTTPKQIYSGCYARGLLIPFAYDPKDKGEAGKKGVGFILLAIQKIRDGKPFGGGGSNADLIDAIPGAAQSTPGGTGSTGGAPPVVGF